MSDVLGAVVVGTVQAYRICCRDAGIAPRDLYVGTPWQNCRPPRLREYVAWSDFVRVMRAALAHEDEIEPRALVRAFLFSSPALRYFTRLLTPFVSPLDVYRAVYSWIGMRLYKNMSRHFAILEDGSVSVEIELFAAQEPCLEFFRFVELCLVAQALVIGCGDAKILSSEYNGLGIKTRLTPPPAPSWIARSARFFDRILGRAGSLELSAQEEIVAAHDEAQLTERSLLTLLDQIPDGLAVIEACGSRLMYSNPALHRILGREAGEIRKSSLLDFVTSEDHERLASLHDSRGLLDNVPYLFEVKTEAGIERKPIEVRYGGELSYKRETCRFMILRDLSTLKDLESKLSQQQRLAVIGELGAGLSHELAAPLAVTFSNLESLLEEPWPAANDGHDLIDAAMQQLGHVTSILKSYSRAAKHHRQSGMQEESLAYLTQEAATICQAKARRASVTVTIDADPAVKIFCRPHQIMQAATNLISNAIDAASCTEFRVVELQVRDCGAFARLTVADSGVIVDPVISERMMEPFFTTKDDGMGLGLTLTRQLIEEHGGRVYLDVAASRTTFVIELRKTFVP